MQGKNEKQYICHLKNSELEPQFQKYKGRVVLRGDIVKDASGSYAVSITNDGCISNGYCIKITRMRRTSSRRKIVLHPGQNGRCTIIVPNSEVRMSRYLDTSTKTQVAKIMVLEDPVVPLERNLYGHPSGRTFWERQFEKDLWKHGGEKVPNWDSFFVNRERGRFLSVCVDATRCGNIDPMWIVLNKEVDLAESTSFLDHVHLGCTPRECQQAKTLQTIPEVCSNPRSVLELQKSYHVKENLTRTFPHGPMTWKVMQRNAWKDIANWRTKQLNSYTMKWDLLENRPQFADTLFWNVYN